MAMTLSMYQFLVLAALLRRPAHPYAIGQEIIALTGWQVWPSKSTLRTVLDRLLTAGYIEMCSSDPHYWLQARRSAPYELTEKGLWLVRRELSMYFEVVVKSRPHLDAYLEKFGD